MANNAQKIGWIGTGRMGTPMAERLLKAGYDVSIWNRTRAKAEPLAAKGGKIVDKLSDLSSCDVVFSIVSEGKDLEQPRPLTMPVKCNKISHSSGWPWGRGSTGAL